MANSVTRKKADVSEGAKKEPRTQRKANLVAKQSIEEDLPPKKVKGWVYFDDNEESNEDSNGDSISELPRTRTRGVRPTVTQADAPIATKRKRRTAAEIARDNSDLADKELETKRLAKAKIQGVALLEDQLHREEHQSQLSAANPPPGSIQEKAPRPSTKYVEDRPDVADDLDYVESDEGSEMSITAPSKKKAKGDIRASIEEQRKTTNKVGDKAVLQTPLVNKDKQRLTKRVSGLLSDDAAQTINPTVTKSKSKPSQTIPKATLSNQNFSNNDCSGLMDDNERDSFPTSPPSKKSITRIIRDAPRAKIEPPSKRQRGSVREKKEPVTQHDLPAGTLKPWRGHIVPAWRDFAGSQENPWDTSNMELCEDLQEIWDLVLPSNPQEIQTNTPIFSLAIQRWYEWRGSIARATLEAVDMYMSAYSENVEERAAHAVFLKGDASQIPFTWKEFIPATDENPQPLRKGLFLSPWIVSGMVAHAQMTGSVCEDLKVPGPPRGALLMSVVSVERAFSFWTTGNNIMKDLDSSRLKFSEKAWGAASLHYIPSIKLVSSRQWEKIAAATTAALPKVCVPTALSAETGRRSPGHLSDIRSSLFEEDSEPEAQAGGSDDFYL